MLSRLLTMWLVLLTFTFQFLFLVGTSFRTICEDENVSIWFCLWAKGCLVSLICIGCGWLVLICAIVWRYFRRRLRLLKSITRYLVFELFKITLFSDEHVTVLHCITASVHWSYCLLHLVDLAAEVFFLKPLWLRLQSLTTFHLLELLNWHYLSLFLLDEPYLVLHLFDLICELLSRDPIQLRRVLLVLLLVILIIFLFFIIFFFLLLAWIEFQVAVLLEWDFFKVTDKLMLLLRILFEMLWVHFV